MDSAGVLQRRGDSSLLSGAADFDAAARSGKGNAMVILVMFVNQVFMGVVGWHSNYFGKWGIYIPMVLIVLYGISEVLFFGGIGWNMEINYLQTAYIIYFLKRIMNKRQRMQEQKNQVNFPKGMGRK